MKYLFILTILFSQLFSAPAFNKLREFTNADGSTFMARAQGNQHLNWIQTQDNTILKYNSQSRNFEYAQIQNDSLRASGIAYKQNTSKTTRAIKNIPALDPSQVYKLWQKKSTAAHQKKYEH